MTYTCGLVVWRLDRPSLSIQAIQVKRHLSSCKLCSDFCGSGVHSLIIYLQRISSRYPSVSPNVKGVHSDHTFRGNKTQIQEAIKQTSLLRLIKARQRQASNAKSKISIWTRTQAQCQESYENNSERIRQYLDQQPLIKPFNNVGKFQFKNGSEVSYGFTFNSGPSHHKVNPPEGQALGISISMMTVFMSSFPGSVRGIITLQIKNLCHQGASDQ